MLARPATPSLASLPGELWDLVIDSLNRDHQTLGVCIGVCRTFRVRALFHLMECLELSHVRPKSANPMELLDLLEKNPTFYGAFPRKILLDCVEFDTVSRPLQTRALRLIPRLTSLRDLRLLSLESYVLPRSALFASVCTLGLEGCSFDARELDGLLCLFPALEELFLASCVIMDNQSTVVSLPAWGRTVSLDLQIGTGFDAPSSGSFEWATQRARHFSYRSLTLGLQSIDGKTLTQRIDAVGPHLKQLRIDLGQSSHAGDAPSKAAMAISGCLSLEELDMHIGYISDLRYIGTPAMSCRSLTVRLTHRNRQTYDQVRMQWNEWISHTLIPMTTLFYHGDVLA